MALRYFDFFLQRQVLIFVSTQGTVHSLRAPNSDVRQTVLFYRAPLLIVFQHHAHQLVWPATYLGTDVCSESVISWHGLRDDLLLCQVQQEEVSEADILHQLFSMCCWCCRVCCGTWHSCEQPVNMLGSNYRFAFLTEEAREQAGIRPCEFPWCNCDFCVDLNHVALGVCDGCHNNYCEFHGVACSKCRFILCLHCFVSHSRVWCRMAQNGSKQNLFAY